MDSKQIIESYINKTDWRVNENSNSPYCYGGLNKHSNSEVSKDYWLRNVYHKKITNAYLNGKIHIHDLGGLTLYTYFGKEVIIVKNPEGRILLTSFQDLYESLKEKEVCVNVKDDVWQISIHGYKVLDKDGWTDITVLTRKAKHRNMRFIKNETGRSVIVTDNHPMITLEGEKESINICENDLLFSADIEMLLKNEYLFTEDTIDLLKLMPDKVGKNIIYADSLPIWEQRQNDNVQFIHTQSSMLPRFIQLTETFGYAIGFILAEGSLDYHSDKYNRITIFNKSLSQLNTMISGLNENQCLGTLNPYNTGYRYLITNPIFIYLLKHIFKIKSHSKEKNIPEDILNYNKNFIKGIFAGVLDGDGASNGDTTLQIRISARTLLNQLALIMPFIGLFPRDISIEGQGTTRIYQNKEIKQNYPIYGLGFRKTDTKLISEKYNIKNISKSAWRSEELNTWSKVLKNLEVNIPDKYIYDITTKSSTLLVNGMYNHNCCGYSLRDILMMGVQGIPNIPTSKPAKHFDAILNQLSNLVTVFQNEIMGAVAFNSFDTLLAPFVKNDVLTYKEVKQNLQNFIFSINSNSRGGAEPAFTNLTFDLTPPDDLLNENVIIGGELMDFTYKSCQKEMDMVNKAFYELMLNGDAKGKPFAYPIPSYNIHSRFDWDNPNNDLLWEMAGRYGYPYFNNLLNSDIKPSDIRSMCCRLQLDLKELRRRNGGLFGSGDSTGSIGVVSINLPRIAYLNSENKKRFFKDLEKTLNLAKDSLEIKRKWLQENVIDKKMIPAFCTYVGTLKNHFSTIGIVGMNEMCENFFGEGIDILTEQGKAFAIEVGKFIRSKLIDFQEETGNLYNFEATPAESTCYRLAKKDREEFDDIITRGTKEAPYYTNSCHIPVNKVKSIHQVFEHQNDLQTLFTGGTVIHLFMNGAISGQQAKDIIKTVCEKYKTPYISISPLNRYCPEHGYIEEKVDNCPKCNKPVEKYQRITGYLRKVEYFNDGKKSEFRDRIQL